MSYLYYCSSFVGLDHMGQPLRHTYVNVPWFAPIATLLAQSIQKHIGPFMSNHGVRPLLRVTTCWWCWSLNQ